jgi:hypothetical protein
MRFTKLALAVPAVAVLTMSTPSTADARTKTIVKYGAIGLGAAALYNMGQQSAYNNSYYGGYYGGGYYPSYYSGYYNYPSYSNYSYSYPSYSYYPSYGYGGGYYYY